MARASFFPPTRADIRFFPGEPNDFIVTDPGIHRDLQRRMVRVKFRSRQLVRVRTGRLFSTIRMESGRRKRYQFVDVVAGEKGRKGTRYLMVEHDGSKPHVIRARRRKFLRFVDRHGRIVFRKSVMHPGTTGSRFLTKALNSAAQ